jgi:hypothetical protein
MRRSFDVHGKIASASQSFQLSSVSPNRFEQPYGCMFESDPV